MIDKQTYAFMAAAAYDERRGSEIDDHAMPIESYLSDPLRGGWTKENRGGVTAGASYSDYLATGMQADVWTKGSEYVIACQSTEGNPANG